MQIFFYYFSQIISHKLFSMNYFFKYFIKMKKTVLLRHYEIVF